MFRMFRLVLLVVAPSFLVASAVLAQAVPCCTPNPDAVVAVIDGEHVRVRDLDVYSHTNDARALFLLNRQLSDSRGEILRSADEERLLDAEASRLGKTVRQLLKERLPVRPVTDAAIRRMVNRIRAEHPDARYDELRSTVRRFLEGQGHAEARARYLRELKQAAGAR